MVDDLSLHGPTARSNGQPLLTTKGPEGFCVVGIGAFAGGLDACMKFVSGLPAASGMAFILVRRLEPTHESMMAELLGPHTKVTVQQAANGTAIEREHFYVIPSGTYLSIVNGALRPSAPESPDGARIPGDFLPRSLADQFGARAACVNRSGTTAEGIGPQAIKDKCGLVIAQDPDEGEYDGMPRTAIATSSVDMVLRVEQIPDALTDVGRPLADLSSLSADCALSADVRQVLKIHEPIEREIETRTDVWFVRRILPYRAHDNTVEGVVITFTDISERKRASAAIDAAMKLAEQANVAKTRFLAAASHDLRQPLQTIALLQGLLAKTVEGDRAQMLVARIDEAIGAMSGILNTLLDINQIEAGVVSAEVVDFPINDLLDRLRDEFGYHAQARKLELRVVPCGLSIRSDPRLLEQMIRNLLSNAFKYTKRGKVLLGCRCRGGILSIEIWDTGIGIPESDLQAIFREYHQLENPAHERSRGLGLGLSIVQSLGNLLSHRVHVRSHLGKGSVFAIEIALPRSNEKGRPEQPTRPVAVETSEAHPSKGAILVVENDPEVRDLVDMFLTSEGHRVTTAADGVLALALMTQEASPPDLILADYNLPNGLDGLQLAQKLRERFHRQIPVIVLTGDISTATLRNIAGQDCVQLNKPVKLKALVRAIEGLLPFSPPAATSHAPRAVRVSSGPGGPTVFVVDDDDLVRGAIRSVLEDAGRTVEDFETCEAFLETYRPGGEGCLLIDAYLPGMGGLELLQHLHDGGDRLPAIMITGRSDVHIAVAAMKAGALDFIEKPIAGEELISSVERALDQSHDESSTATLRETAATQLASLTPRQREIMDLVLAGHPNKNIAADLGISQRTVEFHRAVIMKRTHSKSLPELARLALSATWAPVRSH